MSFVIEVVAGANQIWVNIGDVVASGQHAYNGTGPQTGIVLPGGRLDVGGMIYGVQDNGTIANYGMAIGTVVDVGGVLYDEGITSGTVLAGGTEVLNGGGASATGTVVNGGGNQYVENFANATGTVLNGGGNQYVEDFATANATVLNAGANQYVGNGGIAVDAYVNGGDQQLQYGGTASGTVLGGGEQDVEYGGTASGTVVNSGGKQNVEYGGAAFGTIVNSGGTEIVSAGGSDNGATVSSGGELDVLGGGTATAPTLLPGGSIRVGGTLVLENQVVAVSSGGIVLSSGALMELENAQVSGTLKVSSGATVNAVGGLNVLAGNSGNPIVNFGVIEVENGALVLGGKIVNSGALIADNGILEFVGMVSGGTTVIGNGTVDIQLASSENVTFESGGTGGLELDVASAYTGKVSGFGSNTNQFIDFTHINSAGAAVTYTSSTSNSGVLKVTSGGHTLASIHMVGHYTTANFHPGNDGSGHLEITDPPVVEQKPGNAPATIADDTVLKVKVPDSGKVTFAGPTGTLWLDYPSTFTGKVADFGAQESIDLPGILFGRHTTLGYSENSSHTGGTLSVKDGIHIAKLALLGNYMATSFVTAADGHGGTLITEAPQTTQQPLLSHPHA